MCWLFSEGGLEEIVAQDSEREDGSGKEVTGWARSTSEEPCEDLIVMFLTKDGLVRINLGFSGEKNGWIRRVGKGSGSGSCLGAGVGVGGDVS